MQSKCIVITDLVYAKLISQQTEMQYFFAKI